MIIKRVSLKNIRSYVDSELEFPEGSVLLSGDIGAGKSTVLLAIEFALFGIQRGALSGASLLRNGTKEGSVELVFSLEGQEYTIKRNLKTTSTGISQSPGYIIKDGLLKEATASELRADMLEALGYPKDLLTKNASVVYRYTVYTPQEDMKLILSEDKEARLDTLRKVFGIDKYKRMRENAATYARELRNRIAVLKAKSEELPNKEKLKKSKQEEVEKRNQRVKELLPELEDARQDVSQAGGKVEEYEKTIKQVSELKREMDVSDAKLKEKVSQRQQSVSESQELDLQIQKLQGELKHAEDKELKKDIIQKKNEIALMEKTMLELQRKISEFEALIKHAQHIKEKITKLDNCPTCEQQVSDVHKEAVVRREDGRNKEAQENLGLHKTQQSEAADRLEKLRKELEELQEQEKRLEMQKLKMESLNEKRKRSKMLALHCDRLKQEIGSLNMKKQELGEKLQQFGDVDKISNEAKQRLKIAEQEERVITISIAELSKEVSLLNEMVQNLQKEVTDMKQAKEKMKSLSMMREWILEYFLNLMGTMEKSVMSKVHSNFNEVFISWFKMLMEDETINVRLDDEFSVVVEQNGYEADVLNLSGGEKTSCALAYRLSLNRVINELISTIKTKDIIILDEPTDGFSNDQLDKIRDVLNELQVKQVIIVSHDPKIESYVDHVVRISKREHVSTLA